VEGDRKLEISLLIMCITFAAFMMGWAVHEVIAPEHAQKVFSTYYSTELAVQPLMIIRDADRRHCRLRDPFSAFLDV
jgi:hypothetical protein